MNKFFIAGNISDTVFHESFVILENCTVEYSSFNRCTIIVIGHVKFKCCAIIIKEDKGIVKVHDATCKFDDCNIVYV